MESLCDQFLGDQPEEERTAGHGQAHDHRQGDADGVVGPAEDTDHADEDEDHDDRERERHPREVAPQQLEADEQGRTGDRGGEHLRDEDEPLRGARALGGVRVPVPVRRAQISLSGLASGVSAADGGGCGARGGAGTGGGASARGGISTRGGRAGGRLGPGVLAGVRILAGDLGRGEASGSGGSPVSSPPSSVAITRPPDSRQPASAAARPSPSTERPASKERTGPERSSPCGALIHPAPP